MHSIRNNICIYISKSPAGNRATVPDQDQVQDREADQDHTLFGCPWGAPRLTCGRGSLWLPGPPKDAKAGQRDPKCKKSLFRNRQRMTLGPPGGPLWDNVGDFFEFIYKSWGLDSGRVFFMIFCRKATSAQRLHVAKP